MNKPRILQTFLILNFFSLACIASVFAEETGEETKDLQIADLVELVEPAVVRIDVKLKAGGSVGSGFVVESEGIVVTNHHVIAGAQQASVRFRDGKSVPVVGTLVLDDKRDIAVLKIAGSEHPTVQLAETLPRKGESVVTFGAPKGLSFSASEGIVSAIRKGEELKDYIRDLPGTWVQTSAPISSGNSGGPLVNRRGEVVGANTLAFTKGQNLNFAVSSLDIREALTLAKSSELVELTQGAAKSVHKSRAPLAKGEIKPEQIPSGAFEAFVNRGEEVRSVVVNKLKKKVRAERSMLKLMKSGKTDKRLYNAGKDYGIRRVKGKDQLIFADTATKRRVVDRQRAVLKESQEMLNKVQDDELGLFYFLSEAGPPLQPTSVGAVGHVRTLQVGQIVGAQEFHTMLGKARVAVRGKATQFLAHGSKIPLGLMYISGTETYKTTGGQTNVILVLRELPAEQLKAHLGIEDDGTESSTDTAKSDGDSEDDAAGEREGDGSEESYAMREWNDKAGKHSVEARLIEVKNGKVRLKKRSGKTASVSISKLSKKDLEYLREINMLNDE